MGKHRLLELSAQRQVLVRKCQEIGFGNIVRLVVRNAEPLFAPETEVLVDVKLDSEESDRSERELLDFVLSAEVVRLCSQLDAIRNGVIEHLEVRAGIPRRIVFKLAALPPRQA